MEHGFTARKTALKALIIVTLKSMAWRGGQAYGLTGEAGSWDEDSVVLPLVAALAAAVEDSGRLVATSDLNLHKVGALTAAGPHVGALD
jgi:hypothetical protein